MADLSVRSPTRSGRGRLASLTSSKLRAPDSPIYALASDFQNYMHLPDPMPLYTLMAGVAGNMLSGHPIWLMMVGNSGCGKTQLLKSLGMMQHTIRLSAIKSEAALLSGTKKKEVEVGATGGLLRQMQWGIKGPEARGYGCLVFYDFTSVLSTQRDTLREVLAALREIYDGHWARPIGGEGGRLLEWRGKIAMVAGVTHAIDRNHDVGAEMGERFLYYRFPQTDGYQESRAAANTLDPLGTEQAMQHLVAAMFEACGLSFNHPRPRRVIDAAEMDKMVGLAQFGARARSPVPRDYHTKEVTDIPTPEISTRMTVGLAQLYLGGEEIGLDNEDRWQLLSRIAFDSIPLTRAAVLAAVMKKREMGNTNASTDDDENGEVGIGKGKPRVYGWQVGDVAKTVRCGETSIRRELENLVLLGVIEKTMRGYTATDWTRRRVAVVPDVEKLIGKGGSL